jgi:hypothetical protein
MVDMPPFWIKYLISISPWNNPNSKAAKMPDQSRVIYRLPNLQNNNKMYSFS